MLKMRQMFRVSALGIALGGLGGCAEMAVLGGSALYLETQVPKADWSEVRPVREPRARQVEMEHPISFEDGRDVLSGTVLDGLDDFLARHGIGGNDRLSVLFTPAGSLGRARAEAVAAYLRHRRLSVVGIALDPVAGSSGARLVVRRWEVETPADCPDWGKHPGHDFGNTVMSNFGCATATNFGLMVADPADLVAGRSMGPADGEVLAGAVERYRTGTTRPLDATAQASETYQAGSTQPAAQPAGGVQ